MADRQKQTAKAAVHRKRAEEILKQAQTAKDDETKSYFLELASAWLDFTRRAEGA